MQRIPKLPWPWVLDVTLNIYWWGVVLSGYIFFNQLCSRRFKKNIIEIMENGDIKFVFVIKAFDQWLSKKKILEKKQKIIKLRQTVSVEFLTLFLTFLNATF